MAFFSTRVVPGTISLEQIYKNVTASPDYIRVGLPDMPHEDTNLTIAQIGMIHEYGAPAANIPERPFLHPAIAEGADQIRKLDEELLFAVQNGKYPKDMAMRRLGVLAVRLVQEKIRHGQFVPLKAATIARKGSSQPLIDSGQMVQSVTFEVE